MPDERDARADHGNAVKNDALFEELHEKKGYSKEKAARIANAAANDTQAPMHRGGKNPRYEDWPAEALYEKAQEIGIAGRSRMAKDELIAALRGH